MIAKETLYLTADKSRVVDEASDEQAFLLAAKGSEIPKWAIEKFDLRPGAVSIEGKTEKSKKGSKPSENKAEKAAENKGVE